MEQVSSVPCDRGTTQKLRRTVKIMSGRSIGPRRRNIGYTWIPGKLLSRARTENKLMTLSEAAVGKPFLYEKGWGKKQSYCL